MGGLLKTGENIKIKCRFEIKILKFIDFNDI